MDNVRQQNSRVAPTSSWKKRVCIRRMKWRLRFVQRTASFCKFLQVANMTPQGNNIPPGTFGTAIRNLFNQDSSQFASQVESLVSDFSTNSTKKPATLPTSFDSGTVLTFPGMPWMSYSTPFYVLGADGWASVTPTSVSAVAKKEQTNSNAAPGWIDTFKQTASWYDTTTTNGFFEFDIAKNRTSPDGLKSGA